jgi:hypothetical protein
MRNPVTAIYQHLEKSSEGGKEIKNRNKLEGKRKKKAERKNVLKMRRRIGKGLSYGFKKD